LSSQISSAKWQVRGKLLDVSERTLVMGILNVTPDSFSDGGRYSACADAVVHAQKMLADGADIIDIGGESTRPGRSPEVDATDELGRVLPVLEGLRAAAPDVVISVDTYKEEVARECLAAGAHIINDVYGLRHSPAIAGLVAEHGAGLLLMHMQGEPHNMQQNPQYQDVLVDIGSFLKEQMRVAIAAGVPEANLAIDPGLGFGKTVDHNLDILSGLEYLRLLQRPICIGASRKGFLGKLTDGLPIEEREEATIAAHCAAVLQGSSIIRTHNVQAARRSLAIIDAIRVRQ